MSKVITSVGRQLVTDIFKKQSLATNIGATLEKVEYGHVWIKFPKHEITTQQHGYFHGGIMSYLADISGGMAAISCFDHPECNALAVDLKINFLQAARGDYILGKGKVIQETGSLFACQAEIFSAEDKLVAIMLQTIKKIVPREIRNKK